MSTDNLDNNNLKVCAVIPAYNEEQTIGNIIKETKKYIDTIFVVDDGSKDRTAEIARARMARELLGML